MKKKPGFFGKSLAFPPKIQGIKNIVGISSIFFKPGLFHYTWKYSKLNSVKNAENWKHSLGQQSACNKKKLFQVCREKSPARARRVFLGGAVLIL
jgi:hypothetical protein